MASISLSLSNEIIQYPPGFYQYTQGDTAPLVITPVDFPAGTSFTVKWSGSSATYEDHTTVETVTYDGVNPIVINKGLSVLTTTGTAYTSVTVTEPISGVSAKTYIIIIDDEPNFVWGYLNPTTYYPLPNDTLVHEGDTIGINLKTTGIEVYKDIAFTVTGTATNADYTIKFNAKKYDAGNSNVYFIVAADELFEGDEYITITLPEYADVPNSSFTFKIIDMTPAPVLVPEINLFQTLVSGSNTFSLLSNTDKVKYKKLKDKRNKK